VSGLEDGSFKKAKFNEPAGLFWAQIGENEVIFVADTNNHCIRKIDLKLEKVTTMKLIGVPSTFKIPLVNSKRPPTHNSRGTSGGIGLRRMMTTNDSQISSITRSDKSLDCNGDVCFLRKSRTRSLGKK
jgi:hypothetical protein